MDGPSFFAMKLGRDAPAAFDHTTADPFAIRSLTLTGAAVEPHAEAAPVVSAL